MALKGLTCGPLCDNSIKEMTSAPWENADQSGILAKSVQHALIQRGDRGPDPTLEKGFLAILVPIPFNVGPLLTRSEWYLDPLCPFKKNKMSKLTLSDKTLWVHACSVFTGNYYVSPLEGSGHILFSPLLLSVTKLCPPHNLKTVRDILTKFHIFLKHIQMLCHAQEP